MPEYLAPGVVVDEVPAGTKPIAAVSTSTIGMVGLTVRGPVNVPTLITSFGAYNRVFGGLLDHRVYTNNRYALPAAVQQGFDNGAGRIYVNRIIGENSRYATIDLAGNEVVDGAIATLAERALVGALELLIDDGANFRNGNRLLLSDGIRSEYVTATSDPVAAGVGILGELRTDQSSGESANVQTVTVVNDLSAGVTGDMQAGSLLTLDIATTGGLVAGDILRVRQSGNPDTTTEFVTITASADAAFIEGRLLFDHAAADVEVAVVTMADSGTSTTLDNDATVGATLMAFEATAGINLNDVIAIGVPPEFHVVRSLVSSLSIGTSPTKENHAVGVTLQSQTELFRIYARDQGRWGNQLQIQVRPSPMNETTVATLASHGDSPVILTSTVGLFPGSVISILREGVEITRQRITAVDQATNEVELTGGAGVNLLADDEVVSQEFTLIVELLDDSERVSMNERFNNLAVDPQHPRYAPTVVGAFSPAANAAEPAELSDLVRLSDLSMDDNGINLAGATNMRLAVPFDGVTRRAAGGYDDLASVTDATYVGQTADHTANRTGIHRLTGVDDVSIVAAPGQHGQIVQNALITHCELMRYRFAVLDSAPNALLADVQNQRQQYDSDQAALYYPWFEVADPFGQPDERILLPPSGAVCGSFARTDFERGVWKAPANMVVRNILDLNSNITAAQQQILNPMGINVIRDFGSLRGKRIWGARTISSNTEWRYVNVRRLCMFVEKSIMRGTQYAVFEPNSPPLWAELTRSITQFLTNLWHQGALMGPSAEDAFFVDIGHTTMSQTDIDEGRLVVLIGIAPVKPAEFVILQISHRMAVAS